MTVLTGRRVLASLSAALVAAALASGQPASANGPETVASGLDNPRGITVAPTGDIFVAEAGTGGSGPCFPDPEGGDDPVCFGSTGAVTRIARSGAQERVLTGLPSIAAGGEGATGPSDVIVTGSQKLAVLIGLGADPTVREGAPTALQAMGTLVEAQWRNGRMTTLADIAAQELADNPVDELDSNPVGVTRKGSTYVVADAGGNTIVKATKQGATSTLASFDDRPSLAPPFLGLPPGSEIPMQSVPTAVAIGPDGSYYVSELTGFPFPVGEANIYRVTTSGDVSVYASGLTNVTDLAFAEDGTLYAVEIAEGGLLNGPSGALVRVPAGSSGPEVVANGLFAPYGLALSGHTAYVTTGSVAPGAGEVIRVPLSPDPPVGCGCRRVVT